MNLIHIYEENGKGMLRTSKMQRFDCGNQGNVWLRITAKNKLLDSIKKTNEERFPSVPAWQYACSRVDASRAFSVGVLRSDSVRL
jgi:hypothetical protein